MIHRVVSVSVIEKEKELLAPLLFADVFFAGVFFPLLEDLDVLGMIFFLLFCEYESVGSVVRLLRHARLVRVPRALGMCTQKRGKKTEEGKKEKKKKKKKKDEEEEEVLHTVLVNY